MIAAQPALFAHPRPTSDGILTEYLDPRGKRRATYRARWHSEHWPDLPTTGTLSIELEERYVRPTDPRRFCVAVHLIRSDRMRTWATDRLYAATYEEARVLALRWIAGTVRAEVWRFYDVGRSR